LAFWGDEITKSSLDGNENMAYDFDDGEDWGDDYDDDDMNGSDTVQE
jgi:hypothetical protein